MLAPLANKIVATARCVRAAGVPYADARAARWPVKLAHQAQSHENSMMRAASVVGIFLSFVKNVVDEMT